MSAPTFRAAMNQYTALLLEALMEGAIEAKLSSEQVRLVMDTMEERLEGWAREHFAGNTGEGKEH